MGVVWAVNRVVSGEKLVSGRPVSWLRHYALATDFTPFMAIDRSIRDQIRHRCGQRCSNRRLDAAGLVSVYRRALHLNGRYWSPQSAVPCGDLRGEGMMARNLMDSWPFGTSMVRATERFVNVYWKSPTKFGQSEIELDALDGERVSERGTQAKGLHHDWHSPNRGCNQRGRQIDEI
jgi:hypothetical protein